MYVLSVTVRLTSYGACAATYSGGEIEKAGLVKSTVEKETTVKIRHKGKGMLPVAQPPPQPRFRWRLVASSLVVRRASKEAAARAVGRKGNEDRIVEQPICFLRSRCSEQPKGDLVYSQPQQRQNQALAQKQSEAAAREAVLSWKRARSLSEKDDTLELAGEEVLLLRSC